MSRLRARALVLLAGVAAGVFGAAGTAGAEVGAPAATVQAIAADAQFLEYAPPPAAPGVVCLIDSGVDPNPDTTPILAGSYAMEPGTDTDDELSKLNPPIEPGNHPDGHGTYMAMIMAAPVNGWGMVGIAPTSVRVYNVKALAAGQSTFSFEGYAAAIVQCVNDSADSSGLTVVNLSLGSGDEPDAVDINALDNALTDARAHDLSVVGAAGNDEGSVAYPAAAAGVLAVGSTDANHSDLGVFCATSNRGTDLGILAPGCGSQTEASGGGNGIDVAFSDDGAPGWASGTSDASAIVSAVLTSLRAYAPGLTSDQAENCLTSTTVNGGNLDASAAFRACGLGTVVNQGLAAYQAATSPPSPLATGQPPVAKPVGTPQTVSAPVTASRAQWSVRPRVLSARVLHGRLIVTVAAVPRGARVHVDVDRTLGSRLHVVASATSGGRVVDLRVASWSRIGVFFTKNDARSRVSYVTSPKRAATVSARSAITAGRRRVA